MALLVDPLTMFLALVASTLAAALLLFWCFWLNRGERSLLVMALGFIVASVSSLFMAGRGNMPAWLSIDGGAGLLILGTGLTWTAARVFNGRSARLWVPLAGLVLWLVACRIPAFYASADARLVAGTAVVAAYYLAAAREFAIRDGLLTRVAVAAVLIVHSVIVLLRIPFVLLWHSTAASSFDTVWFGPAALEGVIFIQVIAFLMVSLTKERLEARLRAAALTDSLTGLGNRRAFVERGTAAIAHGARRGRPLAVVVFDLDRFKEINDQHGHPVGDAVIQAFAAAATARLRASDFVGRLGGEEFAVIMPDTTADEARAVAVQVSRAFEAAVAALARSGLSCTASAGVAQSPATGATLDDLLSAADRALYEAKSSGGRQVRLGLLPHRFSPRAAA
jgi:diguanylate cyclase (GGDEF)-like protein